jgi:ABC-2 type transport system ATP-binding protein
VTGWGLEGVTVEFGHHTALDTVDLDLPGWQIAAVVGGDGAGKTTLARVLVGLVEPTRGRVRRPDRAQIGYQSEASGVWGDLTVAENLGFVADAHHLAGDDRVRRVAALLEATRLGDARHRLAARLSGGMRQKLGVAMALLPNPRLLVLDEPTTGLDPVSRTEVWRVIAGAAASGAAVLVTTTYVEEAERAATILALDEGSVLASGTPEQVRAAMQGVVATVPATHPGRYRWRRGGRWRAWLPDGVIPEGASAIEPDLSDLVTVAALARKEQS